MRHTMLKIIMAQTIMLHPVYVWIAGWRECDNADDTDESLILINATKSPVKSYSAGRRKCSFHFLYHLNSC